MKKLLYCAAALATMFFAACQQESLEPAEKGTAVNFTVAVPGEISTKAVADGNNVNELYYAIYKYDETSRTHENGVDNATSIPLASGKVDRTTERHFNVTFDLLADQNYVAIFWAQVQVAEPFYVWPANGDLRTITFADKTDADGNWVATANLEERAAFFRTYEFNTTTPQDYVVDLYRPFAQLNLGTTLASLEPKQAGANQEYVIDVEKSQVKVTGLATSFNTISELGVEDICGKADVVYGEPFIFTLNDVITASTITDTSADRKYLTVKDKENKDVAYEWVAMNYFFATDNCNVTVDYEIVTDKGVVTNTVDNVPVKENYRTNIIGNLLTSKTDFEIVVDANFVTIDEDGNSVANPDNNVEVVSVSTAAQLVEALTAPAGTTPAEGEETNIKLEGDINLNDLFASLTKSAAVDHITIAKDMTITLDLNGYSLTGVDETTANFGLIQNNGNLTLINSASQQSRLALVATNNNGWNRYSAVISNNPGATLTVKGNVLVEHLGGTDMAYGIDILTNGNIGDVQATIDGATVKSTYRAIRQFLNSDSKENELLIKAGSTVLGAENNKAVFFHDPSTKSNNGTLTIEEGAVVSGVYLYVTPNSADWPVQVSIADSSIKDGYAVVSANVPGHLDVVNNNGVWTVETVWFENGDEVLLTSASALKNFASLVNAGDTFEGKTVKLGADIDLKNENWTPIGSAYIDHGFMGNFDGNNKTIKNLTITDITPDSDGYVYAGLFGVTEGTAEKHNYIKNLTIENVNIQAAGHIVSAAIAYPYYTDVENVTVKGNVTIKGGDYTSGVLAYTRRCVNAKDLTVNGNIGSYVEGNRTVGGVVSDIQMNGGLTANYSNFSAFGVTVKGVMHVGGISGIICEQVLDGATVEDVTIVCDDNRKGIVSGSRGGWYTLTNVSYDNVTGATRLVGATYKDGYYVGQIVDVAGVKAIIYTIDDGNKAVSVEELNLKGKNWSDAMAWAEGLGGHLATIEELDDIHVVRFELNDALEADNADNALFEEDEYIADGKYAMYLSSTEAIGNDPQGQAYYANRVHLKYFNLNGYWDYALSTFATINKAAPLKDNHFARAVFAL